MEITIKVIEMLNVADVIKWKDQIQGFEKEANLYDSYDEYLIILINAIYDKGHADGVTEREKIRTNQVYERVEGSLKVAKDMTDISELAVDTTHAICQLIEKRD